MILSEHFRWSDGKKNKSYSYLKFIADFEQNRCQPVIFISNCFKLGLHKKGRHIIMYRPYASPSFSFSAIHKNNKISKAFKVTAYLEANVHALNDIRYFSATVKVSRHAL